MRFASAALTVLALLTGVAGAVGAQLAPAARWRTLTTEHFRVHFTPGLEEEARRAAVHAERAYTQLAAELTPPRGPVDLVVADNVDFSNGYATPFPSNRIVVYAHPPVDVGSLRFYADWSALVVTHELAHVFHLDRSRGLWRVGQWLFGRNPMLFPNTYAPAWVTEGLAVYYETRLTGAGRLAGSAHSSLARAAALEDRVPRPDQWSLASTRFPGGQVAYVYGSLLVDHLARTRGPERVRAFVERTSGGVPFFLDRAARRSFGVTFHRGWREWRDSLRRAAGPDGAPFDDWRELTRAELLAAHPRWRRDGRLVYAANTGKETAGAYVVDSAGRSRRVGRRNGLGPNVPLADGALLFAQLEFLDPYHIRSDLYVQRGARERRLTRDARLTAPDARADGAIVAVQSVPGTTRLVRVTPDGRAVLPLTAASPDTQWAEPRWAPAGDRIAAARWTRGGYTEIVVLDSLGRVREVVARDVAVNAAPAWSPDGAAIVYASDRSGRSELYHVRLAGPDAPADWRARTRRLSEAGGGVFQPALAPDGRTLAAVRLRADGLHVGVATLAVADTIAADAHLAADSAPAEPSAGSAAPPDSTSAGDAVPPDSASVAAAARDTSRSTPYRPWRSLLPRYWAPVAYTTTVPSLGTDAWHVGAATSGTDVIGRHAYAAQAVVNTTHGETDAVAVYRYAGLGRPLLDLAYAQEWSHLVAVADQAGRLVGEVRRRERTAALSATLPRPRARSSAVLTVGAALEWRDHGTEPETLYGRLSPAARSALAPARFPSVFVGAGWSNARRPARSISPENGVTLGVSGRQRWRAGAFDNATRSVTGVASAYRALNLGGFAHHVLAARAAGGWSDERATSRFAVGGTSGGTLELLPGYSVGTGRQTFGVRGFADGVLQGTSAVAGSVEYRLPLAQPSRGLRLLPVFLDRLSLSLFGDAGSAACPASLVQASLCAPGLESHPWIASAGAELGLDTALWYDAAYRFRLGAAAPLVGRALASRAVQGYLTLGLAF